MMHIFPIKVKNNNPFPLLHPYSWVLFSSSSASFSIFPQHTACWIRSLRLKLRALLIVGSMICCLLCAPAASWGTDSTLKRSCYDSHCLQDQAVLLFPQGKDRLCPIYSEPRWKPSRYFLTSEVPSDLQMIHLLSPPLLTISPFFAHLS